MKFFKEITNLPQVPTDLLDRPLEKKVVAPGSRRTYKKDGRFIATSTYEFNPVKENNVDLHDWITSNIYPGCNNTYKIRIHQDYGSSINGPHTDRVRMLALNYYWDLGGSSVNTVWYRYKDKSKPIYVGEKHYPNYDKLEILETATLKTNTWYLLNVGVIHSVENIEASRKYLSLSYWREDKHLLDRETIDWFNNSTK